MAAFQYRAMQPDGSMTEGAIDAGGRAEAMRRLEELGLRPVHLAEGPGAVSAEEKRAPKIGKRVHFRALEAFTRQLASLLSAGVPLARALKILSREAGSPVASHKWREIHDLVVDGASLADAMAQSPETFPRVYTAMVEAGEAGGFLDVVLSQIADFQARERDLRGRVISALIYPSVLVCLALGVLAFLMVFFIPRFKVIFSGFGAQLPLLTQIIVKASEITTQYGLFVLLGAAVVVALARKAMKSEQGRRVSQRIVLRAPVVGPLLARFAMTRFCRMLGTLVGAGVPLIAALTVARKSIGNQILVDAVTSGIDRVRQGETLAASLADCKELFPASVIEMIAVAEETGRLDSELVRLASEADVEMDRQMRTALALAEPLMLFCTAGFIGTIFVGMVVPIFSLQDYIK